MGRPPAFWRLRHKAIPLQVGPLGPASVPRSLAWLPGFGNPGAADRESGLSPFAADVCERQRGLSPPTRKQTLPDSVMVAPQFLVLLVQVQILVG